MNSPKSLPLCPACRKGHLHVTTRNEVFRPRGVEVVVELLASKCDACGVQTTRASQHEDNLRRLAARKQHYGNVLMGEEIMALRKRYGLTQQAAAKIFGKGKIAFSRYENEVTYPDDSTMLLLRMALEKPDSLKWLADKAGVELPMWQERCKDGRPSLRMVEAPAVSEQINIPAQTYGMPPSGTGWHALMPMGQKASKIFERTWDATKVMA